MFVRIDLPLKYSQRRNFFHFFEQKKQNFQKQGGVAPHPIYAPVCRGVRKKLKLSWSSFL